MKILQ